MGLLAFTARGFRARGGPPENSPIVSGGTGPEMQPGNGTNLSPADGAAGDRARCGMLELALFRGLCKLYGEPLRVDAGIVIGRSNLRNRFLRSGRFWFSWHRCVSSCPAIHSQPNCPLESPLPQHYRQLPPFSFKLCPSNFR